MDLQSAWQTAPDLNPPIRASRFQSSLANWKIQVGVFVGFFSTLNAQKLSIAGVVRPYVELMECCCAKDEGRLTQIIGRQIANCADESKFTNL